MRAVRQLLATAGFVAASLVLAMGAQASAPQTRALTEGVFTKAQSERGAKAYQKACSKCHPPAEFKSYLSRWVGLPVGFLYETLRSTMPQDNPGALSRKQFTDVLTYFFEINGLPTGDEELDSDQASLDAVTIAMPDNSRAP